MSHLRCGGYLAAAEVASCELVLAEIPRALHRAAHDDDSLSLHSLLREADKLTELIALLPVDPPMLAAAGAVPEPSLRALDAIHVISAVDLPFIDAFVTYDARQAAAARLAGLRTVAPGT